MENSENMPKCGFVIDYGKNKGKTCQRPAGWGTSHKGEGYCKGHDEPTKALMTKRSTAQLEYDSERLTNLYLAGTPQVQIADALKISQSQVSRGIAALHKRWLENSDIKFDEAMRRDLALYDWTIEEAQSAWKASKAQHKTTQVFARTDSKDKSTQVTLTDRTGDKAYLQIVIDAMEKRQRLLGLVTSGAVGVGLGLGTGMAMGVASALTMLTQREREMQRGQPPSRTTIIGLDD